MVKILYHGTSDKSLPSILEHGLRRFPIRGCPRVYLTDNLIDAWEWAERVEGKRVLLLVVLSDNAVLHDDPDASVADYFYCRPIPPSRIAVLEVRPEMVVGDHPRRQE